MVGKVQNLKTGNGKIRKVAISETAFYKSTSLNFKIMVLPGLESEDPGSLKGRRFGGCQSRNVSTRL